MAQTVNIGTGKVQLTIGHPTDMASRTWANTQLALKADDAAVTTAFAGLTVELTGKQHTKTAMLPLVKTSSSLRTFWKLSTVSVCRHWFSCHVIKRSRDLASGANRRSREHRYDSRTVVELSGNSLRKPSESFFLNRYDISAALNTIDQLQVVISRL